MKVCPVCQYEEEQEDEVSCAICGSDLEAEGSIIEETGPETSPIVEEKADAESTEALSSLTETPSITEEEKAIEEALSASEVPSSDKSDSSNSFSDIFGPLKSPFFSVSNHFLVAFR